MPKSTSTPKTPTKAQRRAECNKNIHKELLDIRRQLHYPLRMPSRENPDLRAGERIVNVVIFQGEKAGVDGPSHAKFRDLGRFQYVVSHTCVAFAFAFNV